MKNWKVSKQLKRNFLIDLFCMPFVSLISFIMGIVFCVKGSWIEAIFICLGVALAIGTVLGIRLYLKEKENEKAEASRIKYLETEVKRMKSEQEKATSKTVDDNDSNS